MIIIREEEDPIYSLFHDDPTPPKTKEKKEENIEKNTTTHYTADNLSFSYDVIK